MLVDLDFPATVGEHLKLYGVILERKPPMRAPGASWRGPHGDARRGSLHYVPGHDRAERLAAGGTLH
jgi:hypothetical protein